MEICPPANEIEEIVSSDSASFALSIVFASVLTIGCIYNGYTWGAVAQLWGAVAQWLERATDNRVVAGSNPAEAVWKLWQFPLPHFASVFRKRH